jgi:hypothetical protein
VNTTICRRKSAVALATIAAGAVAAVIGARLIKAIAAAHTRRHLPADANAALSLPHHEDCPPAMTPSMTPSKAAGQNSVSPPAAASKPSRHQAAHPRATTSLRKTASKVQPGRGSGKQPRHGGVTKQQLYQEARKSNIRGRSSMTKAELLRALRVSPSEPTRS